MNETLSLAVSQLEAALPDSGNFAAGGLLQTIGGLISALKSGDYRTAFVLAVDLLVMARDALTEGGDVINFGASSLAGMDWATLLQVLLTILGALNK